MDNLLNSPEALFDLWTRIYISDTGRYLLFASLMAAFIAIFAARLKGRKLQDREPRPGQRWREIRYSLLTALIFSGLGFTMAVLSEFGIGRVYGDVADYGWPYLIGSLVLMIVAHDAWFYWTHRLIHHPKLFRATHRTHHRSRTPTPWTAYAFDPGEAVINGIFVPLFSIVVPIHPLAIFVFMTHMIARNVIGHSGYELLPVNMKRHPVLGSITNVKHHDLHHRDMHANYGLYFTWWDRWMGTEHPDYMADDKTVSTSEPRKIRAMGQGAAMVILASLALVAASASAAPVKDGELAVPEVRADVVIAPCASDPMRLCSSINWHRISPSRTDIGRDAPVLIPSERPTRNQAPRPANRMVP